MRRAPVLALLLLIGLVAVPARQHASAASLADALLQPADVGVNWKVADAASSSSDNSKLLCNGQQFGGSSTSIQPLESVSTALQGGELGPFAAEMIERYTPDTAAQAVAALNDLITGPLTCTDNGTTFTIAPFDFPDVGDDVFALHLTPSADAPLPIAADIVLINRDAYLITLVYVEIGGNVDDKVAARIANLADQKLADYLGD